MSNEIIEAQLAMLDNLEKGGDLSPSNPQDDSGAGAPPLAPQAVVPGQEPPLAPAPGAAAAVPPATDPHTPQAGTAEVEALKQQVAALTNRAQEFETLYERQRGMVAPLQRKSNELENKVRDLTQHLEELRTKQAQPGSQAPTQPPQAPLATGAQGADNPKLKEFMELYGDMAEGLEVFLQSKGITAQPRLPENLKPALDYAEQKRLEDERAAVLNQHLAPLYTRHPDAGNIVRTPQFVQWIEAKPSYIQDSIKEKVISPELYPVEQVIAIFDDFKATVTLAPPAAPAPSPGEMATEIRRVPTSTTPGGKPPLQPLTRDRMAQINRALTVDRDLYTDEQIAALNAELDQGEAAATSAGFGLAPRLETLTR